MPDFSSLVLRNAISNVMAVTLPVVLVLVELVALEGEEGAGAHSSDVVGVGTQELIQ
jgi:hypothetical protein